MVFNYPLMVSMTEDVFSVREQDLHICHSLWEDVCHFFEETIQSNDFIAKNEIAMLLPAFACQNRGIITQELSIAGLPREYRDRTLC